MRVSWFGGMALTLGLLLSSAPVEAARVELELMPRPGRDGGERLPAVVTVVPESGKTTRREVVVPGELELPSETGLPVRLELEGDGLWADPLDVDAPGTEATWQVWRTAPVHLRLGTEARRKGLPATIKVAFQACPDRRGRRRGPRGTVTAAVVKGSAAAELPRACLDLEILSRDFAPVSIPGVDLTPGRPLTLPPVTLRPGSSIAGTVVSALDGLGVGGVQVRLRSFSGGVPGATLRSTRTDVRGHFRFAGLAPGRYLVEVTRKGAVMARARAETERGAETTLEAMEVGPPATLEAAVDPPDCLGKPWSVCVFPVGESSAFACSTTGASGIAELKGLPAGRYRATLDATCGSKPQTAESQELTLGWGDHASLAFSPALCLVSGHVSVGDEPIAVDLVFVPEALGRSLVATRSDDTGAFRVLLPNTGRYEVQVKGEGVARRQPEELKECPATVDIELPDTVLRGKVLTGEEEPAPGAAVTAVRLAEGMPEMARATALDDGSFVFRGLEPGQWRLRAERGGASSPVVVRSVREGDELSGDVLLVLHQNRTVTLHVVDSGGGPVARAQVRVGWFCTGPRGKPLDGVKMETTDASGDAEVEVPEGCRELYLVAGSESLPIVLRRAGTAPEVTVTLPPGGGRIRFSGRPGYWASWSGPYLALVGHGSLVTLQELVQWGTILHQPFGDLSKELVTPPLEAGTYGLVLLPDLAAMRGALMAPDGITPLTTVAVSRGTTVEVDLARIPGLPSSTV